MMEQKKTYIAPSKEMLERCYYELKLSTPKMAILFGVSKGSIFNLMKEFGIKSRTQGEAISMALTGGVHSKAHNDAISKGHIGKSSNYMVGRRNPMYRLGVNPPSRGVSGTRPDLGIYVRSSWEANYCRYLNLLVKSGEIKKWEYEVDTFYFEAIKRGTRSYTPDFKIWKDDDSFCYHEVKGWMDPTSLTKLKRMKKYYPQFEVIIIGKDWFKANAPKLKHLVPGWEVGTKKAY